MPRRQAVRLLALLLIVLASSGAWSHLADVIRARHGDDGVSQTPREHVALQPLVFFAPLRTAAPSIAPPLATPPRPGDRVATPGWILLDEAPRATPTGNRLELTSSQLDIRFETPTPHGQRARIQASYTVDNDSGRDGIAHIIIPLTNDAAVEDLYLVALGNEFRDLGMTRFRGGPALEAHLPCAREQPLVFTLHTLTPPVDSLSYALPRDEAVRGLLVELHARAAQVPELALAPTERRKAAGETLLTWRYQSLLGARDLRVQLPRPPVPIPIAARMAEQGPLSLLFFLAILHIMQLTRGIPLHPFHYGLLAAAFFSFHLLFAQLIEHLAPAPSFVLSAAVSFALVVSYLYRVVDGRFAFLHAGSLHLLYLVLFSVAHFFAGWTSLTLAAGAVATLFMVMQLTARLDWDALEPVTQGAPLEAHPANARLPAPQRGA